MKIFKRVILLALFGGGLLYALSNGSGQLVSGQEVVLTPQDGHSLNVVRTSGSDANFDIEMSNKGNIYYSAYDQIDDIYLVFHNDVVPGDRIKIHVNSGSFRYNISPVKALPTMVKKALYKRANKTKTVKKPIAKKPKIQNIEPQIIGKKVENVTKSKPIKEKEIIKEVVYEEPKEVISQPTKSYQPKNSGEKVLSDSFYSNFTNIFKDLVKSFSTKKGENRDLKPRVRKSIPTLEPKKVEKIIPKEIVPDKIVENSDERALIHEATMIRRDFSKLPSEIEIFDDSELKKSAKVQKRVFKKIKKEPVVAKVASVVVTPKVVVKEEPKKEITLAPIEKPTPSKPAVSPISKPQKVIVKEDRVINSAPVKSEDYESGGYYPDTGYKDEYKDLNRETKQEPIPKKELPKPELVDNSNGKKIVITKIIDEEKPTQDSSDPFAGRVLGKIDDRVIGGGYNPNSGSGKFGMKVTKNSKPVSAWIEVFKDGTKDRVKTFYTSSSSKIKKVKLPAGVYMIRATYRSKGGKIQKTLKNINLSEGGDITKHITFHDGKLRVIARRGDKSLYVRVTAYRKGTKDRVAFEFSDRHSGITNLTLGTGTYDIEVAEHNNIREFSDIKIKSGAMETIKADF